MYTNELIKKKMCITTTICNYNGSSIYCIVSDCDLGVFRVFDWLTIIIILTSNYKEKVTYEQMGKNKMVKTGLSIGDCGVGVALRGVSLFVDVGKMHAR